jgi:uncharacterized protein (TIGR02271 family)
MKQYAILVVAIGFAAGCAHNDMGTSAHFNSGIGSSRISARSDITPLSEPAHSTDSRGGAALSQRETASGEIRTGTERTSGSTESTESPLYREELNIGKRQVSNGGVLLRKVVETENASKPVELRREEIVIERVNADDARAQARPDTQAFQQKEVVIELHREVPTAEKRAIATEVVRARKTVDTQRQTIADTVRREKINIDRNMEQASARSDRRTEAAGGPAANVSARASSESTQRAERDNAELHLYKEELEVGKREIPSGRVVLKKEITTEQVSRPIELRSEDVKIERAAAGDTKEARASFQQEEIYIPLTKEVPVKEKEVRLAEIVRARKQTETERQNVSAQLRKERVEIIRGENSQREGARIETKSQGAPGAAETSTARQADARLNTRNDIDWGNRERYSGTITMISPESRRVTIRNQQGQTRTFTFSEKPTLAIKENRAPDLTNFKVGYPVTIGHKGDTAEIMIRADTPEVK